MRATDLTNSNEIEDMRPAARRRAAFASQAAAFAATLATALPFKA